MHDADVAVAVHRHGVGRFQGRHLLDEVGVGHIVGRGLQGVAGGLIARVVLGGPGGEGVADQGVHRQAGLLAQDAGDFRHQGVKDRHVDLVGVADPRAIEQRRGRDEGQAGSGLLGGRGAFGQRRRDGR